ncbi:unnamed protein product [Sympodiomycopsis kandeliae]
MPPKSQAAGLNASNIIQGSRKRGRADEDGSPAVTDQQSASPGGSTTLAESSSIPTRRSAAAATAAGPEPPSSTLAGRDASSSSAAIASQSDPDQVTRLGYKLLNIIYHARDLAEQDDPLSLLIEPFLVLPDRQEYADYYQVIKRPLTYEDIRLKLDQREYPTFEQVKHDCEVVCQNAKRYNQKDTPIWLKARALHSIVKDVYTELTVNPQAKSTDLQSKPILLDIGVEGVEPLTSAPPSPDKKAGAGGEGAPPTSSGTRRITIKRKSSQAPMPAPSAPSPAAAPPVPTLQLPPTLPSPSQNNPAQPQFAASPSIAKQEQQDDMYAEGDEDAAQDIDMDAEGEADIETAQPSTPSGNAGDKRRRPFGRGKNLKSAMKQWLNEISDLQDHEGNSVTDFFEVLPDREQLPEYYNIILQPISLKEISDCVRDRKFRSPYAFFTAIRSMIGNAKYYNEENSAVWNDADVIQRHVELKLIPMILSEGFTLDPNDTRSSVLPLGHRENSAVVQSPATANRSLTPGGGQPNRLKVKIGRPSVPGQEAGSALSPSTSSAAESLIDLGGSGGGPPAPARNFYPGANVAPNAPHSQPLPTATSPGPATIPRGPTPTGVGMTPSADPSIGQTAPMATTASGRPVRSSAGVRNLGTPQTITGGLQRTPSAGSPSRTMESPHARHSQPHHVGSMPSMPPGAARSPPGPSQQAYMERPGFSAHGGARSPPQRGISGFPPNVNGGMRPPGAPTGQGGRFVPPSLPSSAHREPRPTNKISKLPSAPAISPFQPPPVLDPQGANTTRATSIPSFVVLTGNASSTVKSSSTPALRKVFKTTSTRQFAMTVDHCVEEVQILFRVKDFPSPKADANKGDDMEADAMEADAEGEADDSIEVASLSSTTTHGVGASGPTAPPQTFANAPSRPPSPERYYKPRILTVYNGKYCVPRWSTTYPPPPAPHHADPSEIGNMDQVKLKEYALLHLWLHPGSNLLEISLFPGPPNSNLEKLAAGEQVSTNANAASSPQQPAALPPRTLRNHVNGSTTGTEAPRKIGMPPGSSPPVTEGETSEPSSADKARELLSVGEGYRIWINRG